MYTFSVLMVNIWYGLPKVIVVVSVEIYYCCHFNKGDQLIYYDFKLRHLLYKPDKLKINSIVNIVSVVNNDIYNDFQ